MIRILSFRTAGRKVIETDILYFAAVYNMHLNVFMHLYLNTLKSVWVCVKHCPRLLSSRPWNSRVCTNGASARHVTFVDISLLFTFSQDWQIIAEHARVGAVAWPVFPQNSLSTKHHLIFWCHQWRHKLPPILVHQMAPSINRLLYPAMDEHIHL